MWDLSKIIKQLHGWLLKFSDNDQRHRGDYKKLPNNVEAFDESGKSVGIIFETTSPFDTPLKMQELIFWIREQTEQKNTAPSTCYWDFCSYFFSHTPLPRWERKTISNFNNLTSA